MRETPKEFINRLGGYREVAARIGISDKTVHSHVTANKLPPRWYIAFCALAKERGIASPDVDLFAFIDLPAANPAPDSEAAS